MSNADERRVSPATINRPATLTAIIIVFFTAPMFFLLMPLYVGSLIDYLHFTTRQVGILTSLELLASATASLTAFFWARRLNWRHISAFAALVLIISNLVSMGVNDHFPSLIAARMVAGFSAGSILAIGFTALSDTDRLDRNFAYGIAVQLGVSGILLMVVPHLILRWGTTAVFGIFCLASLLVLAAAYWLPERGKAHDTQINKQHANAWRPVWGLLGSTTFFIAQTAVWAFVERIGVAANHSPTFIGTVLGVSTLASLVAALGAGFLAERCNRLAIMTLAAAGEVICLAGITPEAPAEVYFAAVLFYSLCWNLWIPIQMSTIAAVDSSGRFIALTGLFQASGIATGPLLIGSLLTEGSYAPVNIVGTVFAIATVLLFAPIARKHISQCQ